MRHENDSTCICTCWAGGSKEKAHHSHLLFLFAIRASICTITAGWVVNRYPCCVWWQLSSHHSWQKNSLAAVLHGAEVSCQIRNSVKSFADFGFQFSLQQVCVQHCPLTDTRNSGAISFRAPCDLLTSANSWRCQRWGMEGWNDGRMGSSLPS